MSTDLVEDIKTVVTVIAEARDLLAGIVDELHEVKRKADDEQDVDLLVATAEKCATAWAHAQLAGHDLVERVGIDG